MSYRLRAAFVFWLCFGLRISADTARPMVAEAAERKEWSQVEKCLQAKADPNAAQVRDPDTVEKYTG